MRLLQQLEERTGRRIHELFDLVAGTSTGGILAVATALKHLTLQECQEIYRWGSQQRRLSCQFGIWTCQPAYYTLTAASEPAAAAQLIGDLPGKLLC